MRHPRTIAAFLVGATALAAACAPRLPVHEWRDAEQAIATIAERAESVRSVSASCTISLRSADGRGATLDGAIVAEGDRRLRIRAWKLNTAVFDLTLTTDGLWIWSDRKSVV
jgi:hypothetical protein